MESRINRLRRMSVQEGRWRSREMLRTFSDRILFRLHAPRWTFPTHSAVAVAVAERLSQGDARCVIDPSLAEPLRRAILTRWPTAADDARERGDRILAGHYDLLGYRELQFTDWHSDPVHQRRAPRICWAEVPYLDAAVGDHKIIWEFNRHQHWLQLGRALWLTGEAKYGHAIVRQLESWLAENPPLTGINWASMLEIGLRTISWTMAMHLLAAARFDLSPHWFVGIERQLRHVEAHLSHYFSPNTHLTGEALALYVVGHAFPELPSSGRWIATGRDILLREIDRQILPDGGHAERSMHYQRYTLDFYLLALLTARRAKDARAEESFAPAAMRVAEFTRLLADDHGRLALIGDDDGGMLWPIAGRHCSDVRDSLAVAAVVLNRPDLAPWEIPEETFWIAAAESMQRAHQGEQSPHVGSCPRSATLADSGYVVLRDREGGHCIVDAGRHGYMNGGHAHADALSLTLQIGKRPLLVDPGTSTYTMDSRLRDRLRSSFNHNTVTIDGRSQSLPAGPFHWQSTANGRLVDARHNEAFDWIEAVHDGYSPIEHRRSIVRANVAGWLVVDDLDGDIGVTHAATAHWHFDPSWMVRRDGARCLRATHVEGAEAVLLIDDGEISMVHGDEQLGLGWYAPVYGTLVPTWTARIARTGRLPFSMITWIGESADSEVAVLERIDASSDPGGAIVAVRIIAADATSTYLIRPGERQLRENRACGTDQCQTDARVMHLRTRFGRFAALDLVDASHVLALDDRNISVAASEQIPDLHARLEGGLLSLAASKPPGQLRIETSGAQLVISANDWTRSPSQPLFRFGAPFALDGVAPGGCEEFLPLRES